MRKKIFFHGLIQEKIHLLNGDFIKIFINKWEAKAIVHAHSPNATAVSSHGKSIPAFHYMIALSWWRRHKMF